MKTVIIILFGLIVSNTACNDVQIKVQFEVEEYISDSYNIINDKFDLEVYIYDRSISENTAYKAGTYRITIHNLPSQHEILLSNQEVKEIMSKHRIAKMNLEGYLTFKWDSDDNGQICKGDLGMKNFVPIKLNNTLSDKKIQIQLKVIDSGSPCNN